MRGSTQGNALRSSPKAHTGGHRLRLIASPPDPTAAAPAGARDLDRSLRHDRPGRTAATFLVLGLALLGAAEAQTTDLLVTGFGDGAIAATGRSALLFANGESSVGRAILYRNGYRPGKGQLRGGISSGVDFEDADVELRDVRWEANPDPRPAEGSPALGEAADANAEGDEPPAREYVRRLRRGALAAGMDAVRSRVGLRHVAGGQLGGIALTAEPCSRGVGGY